MACRNQMQQPSQIEQRVGPTEESPDWTILPIIVDESRNTPLKARRILLGGKTIAQNVSEFDVQFLGEIRDSPLERRVRA